MTGGWLYWLRQMAAASTTLVSGHDAGVRASWAHAESSSRLPTSAAEPVGAARLRAPVRTYSCT